MNATVLILDDSLTVRMDLVEAFEAAGFRTLPCPTAAEARELLAHEPVDVIILDVLLPDGDGVELLAELCLLPSCEGAVVLMLSTEAEVSDRVRALKVGADEYVGKPYDTGYVVSKAGELHRARKNLEGEATTVLVIDDSATSREGLRHALLDAGYEVLTAKLGAEGLRIAAAQRPDAIVVDGLLPDLDGGTVIRRVRLDAALRSTPCLLLTGSQDHQAELLALDAGADAFVRKEDDVAVVLARLAALLRHVTPAQTEETRSLLGPKKILVVDDSPTYLNELAGLLRNEGYDVAIARSGEEALELVAVQAVDCILLDLLMPGLRGDETCRRIKSVPVIRDVPIIMLTSLEDRAAMIDALGAGADDYIQKSSEFEVLSARVRAQIRRKQFEDENRHIRDKLLQREIEATEARATAQLSETRAVLLADLERAKQDAEKANEAKTTFLSRTSHELRTPLNAILGFSQLLELSDLSELDRDSNAEILRAGRQLLALINELLDLSRIETGDLRLSLGPVVTADIAADVATLMAPLASARRLTITQSGDLTLTAVADRQRLSQILLNLVSNAIKYNREGGTIEIAWRVGEADSVEVAVVDTGPGLGEEDLEKIFLPFERLHAEGTEIEGSGIGLTVSAALARAMGGCITVESELGLGTTFCVTLPRAADIAVPVELDRREAAAAAEPAAAEKRVGRSMSVLYVEDNRANIEIVERYLASRPNVSLLVSMSGQLGVDLARQHRPDVILLDIHLPDLSGDEVFERLRAEPSTATIPVVILSADATPGSVDRLRARGVSAYLTKPIDLAELGAVLDILAPADVTEVT